jgi:hypothetical protein
VFGPGGSEARGVAGFDRAAAIKGFQDHHIISHTNPLTRDHPLIKLAGFDLESRSNKVFLPKDEASHPTRSIHNGRHKIAVMLDIKTRMDEIVDIGKSKGWSQAKYKAELEAMLSEVRQDLKAGHVPLNKHMRPWADTQDAPGK